MSSLTLARTIARPVRHRTITTTPPRRLDSLTSLRFFAALAVFAHHFTGYGGGTGFARSPTLFPYSMIGGHGVTFFFVLSGFLLTWVFKPAERPGAFYWRRVGRIWPVHLLMLLPAFFLFYVRPHVPVDWPGLLSSVFLVQGWFPGVTPNLPGNPVTWTLGVEVLFYALFPLLARVALRLRTKTLVVWTAAGLLGMWAVNWCAAAFCAPDTEGWIMRHPVVYLPQFLLGMTVALAIRRGWRFTAHPALPLALLLAWIYGYYQMRARLPDGAVAQLDYAARPVMALLSGLVIVAFVQREVDGRPGMLGSRFLVRLGLWSYSFYLVHQCVIRLAVYTFGRGRDDDSALLPLLGLALVATGAAAALYRFVEEPAARWWNARTQASSHRRASTNVRT
ncbi:acyltransferase [Streptomyces sp. NPDC003077]|uniref:acyltransferase family protein n=1 Tax=Streptomyces sp. NPDC003077 TaxID=3154443 RepID=UPI0033A574E8